MNYHNNSNFDYISAGEQAATAIFGLFCFLLGIPENIAVVVFLLRHFKSVNFTLKLMLNLAASDILCLLTLPVWMYSIFLDWTMGLALCRFTYFVTLTGLHNSVYTVTLMSVHRYVLVLHRLMWNKLGQRGERAILVCVWVLSGLIATLLVITSNTMKHEGKRLCVQIARSESEKVAVYLPGIVLVYVIPLTILITSYLCLQRKVTERSLTNYRLAPLVTSIIVTFVIFTTPVTVVSVMIMATPSQSVLLPYKGLRIALLSIVFLNSCVNPLLYAFNFRALNQSADKNVPQTSNNT